MLPTVDPWTAVLILIALPPAPLTGYVERFIFETSKVSQLFCHQIIWNMKANTYKDDSATEVRCFESLVLVYPLGRED